MDITQILTLIGGVLVCEYIKLIGNSLSQFGTVRVEKARKFNILMLILV